MKTGFKFQIAGKSSCSPTVCDIWNQQQLIRFQQKPPDSPVIVDQILIFLLFLFKNLLQKYTSDVWCKYFSTTGFLSVILLMNGTSVRCVLAHDWLGCPRGVASLVGIPFGGPTAVHNQFRGSRSTQRNHEKNCLRDRFFGDALRDGNRRQCPTTEKLWPPKGETCFYSSKACFSVILMGWFICFLECHFMLQY